MPITTQPLSRFTKLPTKGLGNRAEDHFAGREDVLRTIHFSLENLKENVHHGLRFDGERGIGKSSIFDFLEEVYCNHFDILPVKVNAVKLKTTTSILNRVAREIRSNSIKKYGLYQFKRILWVISDNISEIPTPWGPLKTGRDDVNKYNLDGFISKKIKDFSKYFDALEKVGVSGILVLLDDADQIELEDLGEIGRIFNETLDGYVSYIATATNRLPEIEINDSGDIPEIVDVASGILAYWERVELRHLNEEEMSQIINSYIQTEEKITITEGDLQLLIELSGGNGRLLMSLLERANRDGLELIKDVTYVHITQEIIDDVLLSGDRLAPKLRDRIAFVEARNPDAIRPRWW